MPQRFTEISTEVHGDLHTCPRFTGEVHGVSILFLKAFVRLCVDSVELCGTKNFEQVMPQSRTENSTEVHRVKISSLINLV